jgi:multimeric flavodoxin WrbA
MQTKTMTAILGSPKINGNASKMLNVAIKRASSIGYEVNYVNLYMNKIEYCKGCMACRQTGNCVIKDDMKEITKMIKESDLIVISSPTYFANVTAPVKAMFDRLAGVVMDDNDSMVPKPKMKKEQKYILMTTCSTPFPFDRLAGQSSGCIRAMKEVMNISGMTYGGKVIFAGTRNKKELPERIINRINRLLK